MEQKKNFIEIAMGIFKGRFFSEPLYNTEVLRPRRDWIIVLFITAVLVIAESVFGIYLLFKARDGTLFQISVGEIDKKTTLDKNILNKVIDDMNARKEASIDVISSGGFSDPSK